MNATGTATLSISTSAGGDDSRFVSRVEGLPGARFIGEQWREDKMFLVTVLNGEVWDVTAPVYTDAFAHASSDDPVPNVRYPWVSVLWMPQLAAEMLQSDMFGNDDIAAELHWVVAEGAFPALIALAPPEMCRRVLVTTARFGVQGIDPRDVAETVSAAVSGTAMAFDEALELVDTSNLDGFAALVAIATAV